MKHQPGRKAILTAAKSRGRAGRPGIVGAPQDCFFMEVCPGEAEAVEEQGGRLSAPGERTTCGFVEAGPHACAR